MNHIALRWSAGFGVLRSAIDIALRWSEEDFRELNDPIRHPQLPLQTLRLLQPCLHKTNNRLIHLIPLPLGEVEGVKDDCV